MGSRLLEETDHTPSPVIERLEARIVELEAENARLTAIVDNAPLDELYGCDCCGATTTDAAEVDGHMQCGACSLEVENERIEGEYAETFAERNGWKARAEIAEAQLEAARESLKKIDEAYRYDEDNLTDAAIGMVMLARQALARQQGESNG